MSDSKVNILLVDDHKMIREGIRSFLEGHPTFVVVEEAENGIDALEKYDPDQIDLVVTDILMPEMDGIEFSRRLVEKNVQAKINYNRDVEIYNLNMPDTMRLWGAIGTKYVPSCAYRIKQIIFDSDTVIEDIPAVMGNNT